MAASNILTAIGISASLLPTTLAQSRTEKDLFPNPKDEDPYFLDKFDIETQHYIVNVIGVDHPYNTNQNIMDMEYWSTWDSNYDTLTFHVKLRSRIEIDVVDSKVY
jgi:hypothetical protein